MYKIPYNSLTLETAKIDYSKIKNILDSNWVCLAQHTKDLESNFRKRFNIKHAILCANATSGLIIAIKAANWKNLKVALPAFTWPSTSYAIECSGNIPVYCDIDKDTWHIKLPNEGTYDCVLAMDTFGNEINIESDKPVIYDAAHGFDLPNLGNRGIAEVVSFSYTKLVTGMQGGVILTNDDLLAESARELVRVSAKIEEINAYILETSLKFYDESYKKIRQTNVDYFLDNLNFNFIRQKITTATNNSVFGILFESSKKRDKVRERLEEESVEVKIYYEPLITGLPNTDEVYSKIMCLPVWNMQTQDLKKIVTIINDSVKN